ncbi:MAG: SPFH/Band 7/PHB domain protein [Candidatus Methanomethylophilaceae archaeon]|jgi:regulator of protease activity HflC (stomatin/prohibitin superfamily)|nr:SPFH/Band 7/PHB domain protein [Candidatus Methanomethylophilaceae archaeon]MBR4216212.1 SPFH/Band 7/PHB domain protein [Candidatus Methanomethylophilaceae archaeon]MBR6038581.1 SPFH/Band 7/PHB domain protein [Candidatus Methanomethylophilaceae archaeon]MBR7006744.1 SPFH/Band 7/PHB domain protein [Candidatus Methanomethylophilaceae archaeon]
MSVDILLAVVFVVMIAAIVIITSGVKIVQPYEQAIYMRLGKFVRVLGQGLNIVCPLINKVVKMDLRTEVLDVPKQEVITKDNSPVNVDAVIYIKVTDPKNAFFEVTDYRLATVNLAQTTLRSIIGEMELDEILSSREKINLSLRDILDESTDKWGVKIEAVEIREVDPARKVKDSMEEQTSAERRRRAAILQADGQKRAAILEAEGKKKSRILEAEGLRQSMILEAEGKRLATILEGQGEAQKLRILSVGAASMDSKALSVLSMQTIQEVGKGESSKIFFPMEVTRLVEGISEYVGSAKQVPDREVSDVDSIKEAVGNPDDILGPIPTPEEIKAETDKLDAMMKDEMDDVDEIVSKEPRV